MLKVRVTFKAEFDLISLTLQVLAPAENVEDKPARFVALADLS